MSSPSTTDARKIIPGTSTGFSPRIHPRPAYPSVATVILRFVHNYLILQCLVGAVLVQWLLPFYRWTRLMATKEYYAIDDRIYFTVVLATLHTAMYVGCNLPYLICDVFKLFQSWKLYRMPYMEPKRDLLIRLGIDQAISQLAVTPLVIYFASPIFQTCLQDFDTPAPSLQHTFTTMVAFVLVNDVMFYWFHRLLHSKALYKLVHKKHHEFTGSVGYAAEYAHPIEGLLSNQLPIVAGMFLTNCHPLCFFVYIAVRLQDTYEGHSGYCFFYGGPLQFFSKTIGTAHHDYHHTHNKGNFGAYWLDWIFGTMDHYQSTDGFEGYMKLKSKDL